MKTKQIAPWNLKVGQRLVVHDLIGNKQSAEILSIEKKKGYFTGRPLWHVKTNHDMFSLSTFHGKGKTLPYTKAEIVVN